MLYPKVKMGDRGCLQCVWMDSKFGFRFGRHVNNVIKGIFGLIKSYKFVKKNIVVLRKRNK